jgi:hypothetical protein
LISDEADGLLKVIFIGLQTLFVGKKKLDKLSRFNSAILRRSFDKLFRMSGGSKESFNLMVLSGSLLR